MDATFFFFSSLTPTYSDIEFMCSHIYALYLFSVLFIYYTPCVSTATLPPPLSIQTKLPYFIFFSPPSNFLGFHQVVFMYKSKMHIKNSLNGTQLAHYEIIYLFTSLFIFPTMLTFKNYSGLFVHLTRGMNMWTKFDQSTSVLKSVKPRVDTMGTEEASKANRFNVAMKKSNNSDFKRELEPRNNPRNRLELCKGLFICGCWNIFWLSYLMQKSLATQRTSLWCVGGSSGWRMARCSSTSITRMAAWASRNPPKTRLMTLPRRSCASCTSLSW